MNADQTAAQKRREDYAQSQQNVAQLEQAIREDQRTQREVVVIGWDGVSQPIYRYADELHLPDHQRATVPVGERKA